MIFVHFLELEYHALAPRWRPVCWIEDEKELKGMAPGTYALHEGSQTEIDEGPDDAQNPLPSQLNFLGIREVQTPEGVPDNAPVAGLVEMVVKKPKKPRKPKKEKK